MVGGAEQIAWETSGSLDDPMQTALKRMVFGGVARIGDSGQ